MNKMKEDFYTVIIKKYCPYSINAVTLLQKQNLKHHIVDFHSTNIYIQNSINDVIKRQNGEIYNLFPKIFKNEVFIGGFDNLKKDLKIV